MTELNKAVEFARDMNVNDFKNAINAALADKIQDRLQIAKKEIADIMFGNDAEIEDRDEMPEEDLDQSIEDKVDENI